MNVYRVILYIKRLSEVFKSARLTKSLGYSNALQQTHKGNDSKAFSIALNRADRNIGRKDFWVE